LERLLDDGLELPNLLGASQLGEHVFLSIAFTKDVIHFETFKIFDERLHNVIVLEQHCFLGLACVGNLPLDKLQVYVASKLLSSDFSAWLFEALKLSLRACTRVTLLGPSRMIPASLPFTLDAPST